MDNSQREELLDRLMHQALEEKLGSAKPCDVADNLSAAAPVAATAISSRTWFRMTVAASVMVAVGLAIGMPGNELGEWTVVRAKRDSARTAGYSKRATRDADHPAQDAEEAFYADDNETSVIMEGTTVQLPAEAASDVRGKASERDWISNSAGPAGGISADANGGVTVEPMPGKHSDGNKSARGPSVLFKSTSIYGEGKPASGDDIVAYDLPATGSPYDRMPVLPPVTNPTAEGYFEPRDERRFAIDLGEQGRDRFARLTDNRFLTATDQPLSTFSIDVDTASYSVVRSRIEARQLPPPAAVRVEELVNYFAYNYPQPTDGTPFAVHVDVAACPWAVKHRLVRIGLKGKEIAKADRPASNLVFLVDVSGSMQPLNKLPLVRQGLLRLVGELDERDRVAIVVYAGSSGCVLASTPCTQANKERIRSAIAALESGGSTNGAAGIELAYQIAQDHFVKGGANRVILCTDGDFNVGTTDDESLKTLVADRAKSGVFLTALGFGMGNHNDQMLETIADNGNGAYGYIDDEREVEKLFVRQLSGTLITIAKDVKIQVEFNPALVGAYRLIGYENRILAKEDFNNDKKDAGDIGAGHTVTALYEIVPPAELAEANKANAAANEGAGNAGGDTGSVDALEFQRPKQDLELTDAAKASGDLLLVKLRYKAPDGDTSTLIKTPAKDPGATFAAANSDFKFAAAVAAFGMILRQSPFRGDVTLAAVEEIAAASIGEDPDRQRKEFVDLVRQLRGMTAEGRGARD